MTGRRQAWGALACVLAVAGSMAIHPAGAQTVDAAERSLRTGSYEAALLAFQRLTASTTSDSASLRAYRGLVRTLVETGRYDDAEAAARRGMGTPLGQVELSNALGEVLYARGKIAPAEAAFRAAMTQRASDSLTARVNLAILQYERGEVAPAMQEFDRFIDFYNGGNRLTSAELSAVATAVRYLGIQTPALVKDALRAYDEAVAADSTNLEPRIKLGYLFLEKYNSADAQQEFLGILSVNPLHPLALLGSAKQLDFDGLPGADSLAQLALTINANLVPALVFVAQQRLGAEDYAGALETANKALTINPVSLPALSVIAAIHYLADNKSEFEDARRRVLTANPRYADLYSTIAELAARVRFYRQAADLARTGVGVDSGSSRALSVLGMNLLRIGQIDEARRVLERSFALDPYDLWVKNTLDLLDTFGSLTETKTPRFVIVADKAETDLLALYASPLAEKAYDQYVTVYGYRPTPPVRVEFYKRHADFSVRTVGLSGIGALGVTFGTLIAMDAPSARPMGQFNWGSTLWHELGHTFTLEMTDHRIPRWFSEGLSVYEERRAGNGWGMDASVGFLVALKQGKLKPVSRLNEGFMRPSYPEQLQHSYYEASLVCELIARDFGPTAIPRMLTAYKDGKSTENVFSSVLGSTMAAFDSRFAAYLGQRFATTLAALHIPDRRAMEEPMTSAEVIDSATKAPGDYLLQVAAGGILAGQDQMDAALIFLQRAALLFPDDGEPDGPHAILAAIYKQQGKLRESADELTKLTLLDESAYQANVTLGEMLLQLGDTTRAAAALDRAMYISPLDIAVHQRLAALYQHLVDHPREIRERRAVLALRPVDLAEAYYQVADAYARGGDPVSARREVLHALEEAPNFEKAQKLLLTVRAASPATPAPR